MITQYGDYLSVLSYDGGAPMVLNTELNVVFEDNWEEYNGVYPMGDRMFYCKDGEFGLLVNGSETILIQDEFIKWIIPMYNLNLFLVYNGEMYKYIDVSVNQLNNIKLNNMEIDAFFCHVDYKRWTSLIPYRLTRREILQWTTENVLSWKNTINAQGPLNLNDIGSLLNVKGLLKINDVWKNIYYPHFEEQTII